MTNFQKAEKIIKILEEHGHQAYIVGGAVRDMLLSTQANDIDIASSAKPGQISEIFKEVIDTGALYGTVTVIFEGEAFEITKFRSEGEYEDCRHPLYVLDAGTIEEDLSRRDFTINAMAYNKNKGIIDPHGGFDDLKAHIIKTVGDPEIRFAEDPLRILRGYRFASLMNFEMAEETKRATLTKAHLLSRISVERVAVEIIRLLSGEKPSIINPLLETGALENFGIYAKDISLADSCSDNVLIRFCLLSLKGNTKAGILAKSLFMSNSFVSDVSFVEEMLFEENIDKITLKRYLKNHSLKLVKTGLLARQDILSEDISSYKAYLDEIIQNKEPYCLADLKISGKEIMKLGFVGKDIGRKLDELLEAVLKDPELNEEEALIKIIN